MADRVGHVSAFEPIPDDPDRVQVGAMFDADATWVMADTGEMDAAAVQTFMRDGTGLQEVIALRWPGRLNKTNEHTEVRMMMSAEDAMTLAAALAHSARFVLTRKAKRQN